MNIQLIVVIAVIVIAFVGTLVALLRRYKRCPSDKLLVIYGKVGGDGSSKVIHGGAAFIFPIIQDYQFLDLKPIAMGINLTGALTSQNIRIDIPTTFTIAISSDENDRGVAAERLLGLNKSDIQGLAEDIIFGQLRLVVASMTIEEINADRDKFLGSIRTNLENELKKVGLKLINVNIKDINDESGYINALGKKAAAEAINQAKIEVAKHDKSGAIGEKTEKKEQRLAVATLDADTIVGEAEESTRKSIGEAGAKTKNDVESARLSAETVKGKNTAEISIAKSDSLRSVEQAEALRISDTAKKVKSAKTLEDSYSAEKDAEIKRAEKDKATLYANEVVPATVAKEKAVVEAEAQKETEVIKAEGDAAAILSIAKAKAEGEAAILIEQAVGFEAIVKSAGGSVENAIQLMLVDKVEKVAKMQYDALANFKIDKVTVWDSGNGSGGTGTAVPDFVKGLMTSIPGLQDVFGGLGLQLPTLAQLKPTEEAKVIEDVTSIKDEPKDTTHSSSGKKGKKNSRK